MKSSCSSWNIFVSGSSTNSWDGSGGEAPLHEHTGASSGFVLALDSAGVYRWHTFFGTLGSPMWTWIAVDETGDLFVAGTTQYSWDGPSGESPLDPLTEGGAIYGTDEAFVLSLNQDGSYRWHGFYGSDDWDFGFGVAIGPDGEVIAAGSSESAWLGPCAEDPIHEHNEIGRNIMFLGLTSNGGYGWHTFFGHGVVQSLVCGVGGMCVMAGFVSGSFDGPGGESPLHEYSVTYGYATNDLFVLAFER